VSGASARLPVAEPSPIWPPVLPGRPLRFPRDHGAHAPYRTEWWYLTGWLEAPGEPALGVQITFFRSRTRHDGANPSRFAPTQLLFAHAAIASPRAGRLVHAQRSARAGFGLAGFSEADLDVAIGSWELQRDARNTIHARIDDESLALDLRFTPAGPPVPQGDRGYSRKGPEAAQASWYYSLPQLAVDGRIRGPDGVAARAVRGHAWLDHEWSSEILHPDASGWDWVGLNLDDGSALMAFRIRHRDGSVLWSDAHWIAPERVAGRELPRKASEPPRFLPLRHWRSARSGASWPVAMRIETNGRLLVLEPLLDDQEIDASASTGTVYWEGAVVVLEGGRRIGAGYLELTGYAGELRL
jgi:predicted secreted hydrolase